MQNDIELPFPIGGLSKAFPYSKQPPNTTPGAINVMPYDGTEHRFRGGVRPGFRRRSSVNLGGPPVFMVSFPSPPVDNESFRLSFLAGTENELFVNQTGQSTVGGGTVYTEEFVALSGVLYTEEAVAGDLVTYISPSGGSYFQPGGVDTYVQSGSSEGYAILTEDDQPIQAASFSFGGRRTDATPFQGGVVIPGSGEVVLSGTGRLLNGVLVGDNVTDWNAAGVFTLDHLVEIQPVEGSELSPASYMVRFDLGPSLYLDSGSNAGRCTFRVVDGPKFISAASRSVVPIESPTGNIPYGADLVATYLDRLVFVKDRVWYMSRQGDSGDWDYFADAGDLGRAVAGVTSDAGLPGDPIVALASRGNDYLVMFAAETTWVMRGDPAAGGVLYNISRSYGCVDFRAWCHGDTGEIYFLSKEGLCVLADGGQSRPEPVSAAMIPDELRNIDSASSSVSLVFDVRYRGVWVFVTPKNGSAATHYWYSKLGNSFWPIRFLSNAAQPAAATIHASSPAESSAVLIGDMGGVIRKSAPGLNDDGLAVSSSVILGPYLASESGWRQGLLTQLVSMLGAGSGSVLLAVYVGNSPEDAATRATTESSPSFQITLDGLRSKVFKPRIRGVAFCVKISSDAPWVFESLVASVADAGQARI